MEKEKVSEFTELLKKKKPKNIYKSKIKKATIKYITQPKTTEITPATSQTINTRTLQKQLKNPKQQEKTNTKRRKKSERKKDKVGAGERYKKKNYDNKIKDQTIYANTLRINKNTNQAKKTNTHK